MKFIEDGVIGLSKVRDDVDTYTYIGNLRTSTTTNRSCAENVLKREARRSGVKEKMNHLPLVLN